MFFAHTTTQSRQLAPDAPSDSRLTTADQRWHNSRSPLKLVCNFWTQALASSRTQHDWPWQYCQGIRGPKNCLPPWFFNIVSYHLILNTFNLFPKRGASGANSILEGLIAITDFFACPLGDLMHKIWTVFCDGGAFLITGCTFSFSWSFYFCMVDS